MVMMGVAEGAWVFRAVPLVLYCCSLRLRQRNGGSASPRRRSCRPWSQSPVLLLRPVLLRLPHKDRRHPPHTNRTETSKRVPHPARFISPARSRAQTHETRGSHQRGRTHLRLNPVGRSVRCLFAGEVTFPVIRVTCSA
ncbi:hypothetical protein BDW22DRAFT_562660 [Trametopsis cervina]|nr:hypothetical protein BDW22DRAFT_562660 [Trametopsis cervina]